jgi:hypothetical protein
MAREKAISSKNTELGRLQIQGQQVQQEEGKASPHGQ